MHRLWLIVLIVMVCAIIALATPEREVDLSKADIHYLQIELADSTKINLATLLSLEMPEGDTITLMIAVDENGDCEVADIISTRETSAVEVWCDFLDELTRIIKECKK